MVPGSRGRRLGRLRQHGGVMGRNRRGFRNAMEWVHRPVVFRLVQVFRVALVWQQKRATKNSAVVFADRRSPAGLAVERAEKTPPPQNPGPSEGRRSSA